MTITLQQLNKISAAIVGVRGQLIADAINEVFPLYGMMDAKMLQFSLPNIFHESASLTRFEENLNYSIKGLLTTFSRKRISIAQCNEYGRIDGKRAANKQAIANTVYGGSYGRNNLGNTLPDDGYELRGSSGLQMTGEWSIGCFAKFYNKLMGANYTTRQMAVILRDPANLKIAMHAACWFIKHFKKLIPHVIAGDFKAFVKGINGGYIGLNEREMLLISAKKWIV